MANFLVLAIIFIGAFEETGGIMAHPRGCVLRHSYINCTCSANEVPIESILFSGGTATVITKVPHNRSTGFRSNVVR